MDQNDELLTPAEAALLLKVSPKYLRISDCAKVLLPANRGTRSIVRYWKSEVLAWAEKWSARSTRRKAS